MQNKNKAEKEIKRIDLLASGNDPEIQGPNFTQKDTQLWKT